MNTVKKQMVFLTKEEIERLQEVAKEYNKLKKCLGIGQGDYDYDTKAYSLVQRLDLTNPVVKELGIVARKVDMILAHLGLAYNDEPSLLKLKKCIETE
jgi:hypothetical protein